MKRLQNHSYLLKKASVNKDGAVLLGKYISCDGFDYSRKACVLTHIHQDHIAEFDHLLSYCEPILTTHATKDLLIAIKGDYLRYRRNLIGIDYKTPINIYDEKIILYPSKHILGSCQVLVEDYEGDRIMYSSDFDTTTMPEKADILVIDATYGHPDYIFTNETLSLENKLVEVVINELNIGKSVVILSSRGKLQRLMHVLRDCAHLTDISFLTSSTDLKIVEVYEKYGYKIGKCININSDEGKSIIFGNEPFLAFLTIESSLKVIKGTSYTKIIISEWRPYGDMQPIIKSNSNYVFAISDHSDFKGILEYIKACDPKIVIVDAKRSGVEYDFAQAVEMIYPNIYMFAMP